MARSTLGKYLQVGDTIIDPLQISTEGMEPGLDVMSEWFTVLCVKELGLELLGLIEELIDNSSLQKGYPRLTGYGVDFSINADSIEVSVVPSDQDKRIGLNIFELLDRGNDPGTGLIQSFEKSMIFNEYTGNVVTGQDVSPISFGQVDVSPIKLSATTVQAYEGRRLYQRVMMHHVDERNVRRNLRYRLRNRTARQIDADIRSEFRAIFGQNFVSQTNRNTRNIAFDAIDLFGLTFLENVSCKITEI